MLRAVMTFFCKTRGNRPLAAFFFAVMTLGLLIPSYGQNVFNCSAGFTTGNESAACGVATDASSPYAFKCRPNGCSLPGTDTVLFPANSVHSAIGFVYQTAVNVQAFTTTFTFVPDGQFIAFTLNNTNDVSGYEGANFAQGAGCEAGFYQAFPEAPAGVPNNLFAIDIDSYQPLTSTGSFSYSNVQLYQQNQSNCNPNDTGPNYWPTTKLSTSPVPLNSPSGTPNTTTGHTYSATISYDGTNLGFCMYDVTLANGSCSSGTSGSGTFFQQTWSNVNIPALVSGNTAYVAITGSSLAAGVTPNCC